MAESENSGHLLQLLTRIASAIRLELGEEIDAYPGLRSPEQADPINRAFRAIVGSLIDWLEPSTGESILILSRTLRRLAEQRLASEGWDDQKTKFLLEDEPGSPDDWLAFLILSDRSQIETILDRD